MTATLAGGEDTLPAYVDAAAGRHTGERRRGHLVGRFLTCLPLVTYRACGNGVVAPVAEWIGRRQAVAS